MLLHLALGVIEGLTHAKKSDPNTGYFRSWKRALVMFSVLFVGFALFGIWVLSRLFFDAEPWAVILIGLPVYYCLYWAFLGTHSFDFLVQPEGIWIINRVWGFRSKEYIPRNEIKQIDFVTHVLALRAPFRFLFCAEPSSVVIHFHSVAHPRRIWCVGLEHDCCDENNCTPLYEDLVCYVRDLGYPYSFEDEPGMKPRY